MPQRLGFCEIRQAFVFALSSRERRRSPPGTDLRNGPLCGTAEAVTLQ